MKKGDILPHVRIEKLVYGGNGLSTDADGKRIVIIGGGIPGSIVSVRILKSKKNYLETQVYEVEKPSPIEQELPEKFEVYGGCKWLPIPYEMQLAIKQEQIQESLRFFIKPDVKCHPILPSPEKYGYRNKIEFSWGKYISEKEAIRDDFRFGFHKQGAFDRVVNMKYCVLADEEANTIFGEVDTFSRASGLPTYDPKNHIGFWRHLVIRRSKKRNQTMLVFSLNHDYDNHYDSHRKLISDFIELLSKKHPHIHAAYILKNNGKADIVQGELDHCFGGT
jgi:23S rRNA (uracil1939-C5)-methyltransferase